MIQNPNATSGTLLKRTSFSLVSAEPRKAPADTLSVIYPTPVMLCDGAGIRPPWLGDSVAISGNRLDHDGRLYERRVP